MKSLVLGLFHNSLNAKEAFYQLRDNGYENDLSIMSVDTGKNIQDKSGILVYPINMFRGMIMGGIVSFALVYIISYFMTGFTTQAQILLILAGMIVGGLWGKFKDNMLLKEYIRNFKNRMINQDILIIITVDRKKKNEIINILNSYQAKNISTF